VNCRRYLFQHCIHSIPQCHQRSQLIHIASQLENTRSAVRQLRARRPNSHVVPFLGRLRLENSTRSNGRSRCLSRTFSASAATFTPVTRRTSSGARVHHWPGAPSYLAALVLPRVCTCQRNSYAISSGTLSFSARTPSHSHFNGDGATYRAATTNLSD